MNNEAREACLPAVALTTAGAQPATNSDDPSVFEVAPSTSGSSQEFAGAFLTAIGSPEALRSSLRVLDVGTGSARIPIEICGRRAGIEVIAVDRGARILRRARRNIDRAAFGETIRLHQADAGALPYGDAVFDAIISNALLHHVPRPLDALREMVRVLQPGGLLFVRDSLRQRDAETIARILSRSAAGSGTGGRSVVRCRYPAALTLDEARALVAAVGLPADWVRHAGPRHWLLAGSVRGTR